jgi:gliding motility-associated-like protein
MAPAFHLLQFVKNTCNKSPLILLELYKIKSSVLKGKFCLFIILLILPGAFITAQIFVPDAADSVLSAYTISGNKDIVYIINVPLYNQNPAVTMKATAPDMSGGWTFTWGRYNRSIHDYINMPSTPPAFSSQIDTLSVNSGYRVTMTKPGNSFTYRVWVLFNDYDAFITNKDSENKLEFGYYNCSSLDLRADTVLKPLKYIKPFTDSIFTVTDFYTVRWTTDNPDAVNPSSRLITREYDPPYRDTWYKLKLTDRFGLVRSDSVLYVSIVPKAEISAGYISLGNTSEYPGKPYGYYYGDDIKSAPGKYSFSLGSSVNANKYLIDFGDGSSLQTDAEAAGEVVHEYLQPGTYKVILTAKGDLPYECIDSASVSADLVYAAFSLPNVFTPNDDGDHDMLTLYDNNNVFRSADVSVMYIDITIFDRAGIKVHVFSGNIRDWPGWDGRIMGSDRKAPEGVYYYVISVFHAFEDKNNPVQKNLMRGFFHLYRE